MTRFQNARGACQIGRSERVYKDAKVERAVGYVRISGAHVHHHQHQWMALVFVRGYS